MRDQKQRSGSERGVVLVTGASAGIGRELALEFAARGHDLVLVARTRSELEELADEVSATHGRRAEVIDLDLTQDDAPRRLLGEVRARGLEVEVLVNNAGTGEVMHFQDADVAVIDNILALNVVSLTRLARLFVEPMVARGHGRILNVASVAAFQPVPRLAVYGATKAYVLSLTEALAVELAGTGVTVSALCPGFVDTDLVRHLGEDLGQPDFVPSFLLLDAHEVARDGVDACMAGEVVHISGRAYEWVVKWLQLQPRWFVRNFTGFLSRQVGD